MMKHLLLLLFIGVFLSPGLSLADCANTEGYTSWIIAGEREIILYRSTRPLAEIQIRDCRVNADSQIFIYRTLLCGGDVIEVDGEKCEVFSVSSLAFEGPTP